MMPTTIHALRLHPGEDLKSAIQAFAEKNDIRAGSIVSGVGSLKGVSLRFANQEKETLIEGPLEIVSLTGTVSKFGSHIHASVSNGKGVTVGGHLKEGSKIYTTAEITILEAGDLEFRRELDPGTGYPELSITKRK